MSEAEILKVLNENREIKEQITEVTGKQVPEWEGMLGGLTDVARELQKLYKNPPKRLGPASGGSESQPFFKKAIKEVISEIEKRRQVYSKKSGFSDSYVPLRFKL